MPLASNYPTSNDDTTSLPDPNDNSFTDNPDHAQLHAEENAILRALETKLGFGASTPTVGTTGYLLTSNGNGSTSWTAPPVSAVWGLITGTLSSQTDLSTALGTKVQLGSDITGTILAPLVTTSNGVPIATTTGIQVLTNKTLTAGLVTADPVANLGIASKQYVDNQGTVSLVSNETPGGLINGANTAYTTASTYATGSLKVFLNGQRLSPGSGVDYVEVTQGFTMQYAPATGDVLEVDYNVTNSHFVQGSNSIIVQETPTGTVNGSTTVFTVLQGKYVANSLEVFINGLQQTKTTDYTETTPGSGIFTFVVAPLTGDVVKVSYQFSTGAAGNADTVDGIHANATATANQLTPLDSNARFDQATLPLGAVVQAVHSSSTAVATGTTTIPYDDTIPQNTEGDQYMTASITPKSITNRLFIECVFFGSVSVANEIIVALFQDSTANALAAVSEFNATATARHTLKLGWEMPAGTTSATTFKVRAGCALAATTTFNGDSSARRFGGAASSWLRITEVKA